MGPKKKLKSVDCLPALKKCVKLVKNVSEIEDVVPSSTSDSFANLYFALLPNEVMLYIIKYLSPADILSLEGLKDQRITLLTETVKEANFSSCRTANIHVSSFFTAPRTSIIKKINFNYEMYAKPSVLVHCITKCRHLTHLSIVNCGINYRNLWKILQKCTELRELVWNIGDISSKSYSGANLPAFVYSNVKVLYLFFDFHLFLESHAQYLRQWVEVHFPLASCIFVSSAFELLPICGARLMSPRVSDVEPLVESKRSGHNSLIFTNRFFTVSSKEEYDHILNKLFRGSIQDKIINNPPYLLFHSNASDIASLSSSPRCVFSSVSMVVTPEFRKIDIESVLKCVQEVAGSKLRHLSVHSERPTPGKNLETIWNPNKYDLHMESTSMYKFLNQTLHFCKNITFLDIATTHFYDESPFHAICPLQNLRTLSIPTCAFHIPITMLDFGSASNDTDAGLLKVVSSCPMVNNFILTCCNEFKESVREKDLFPMKFWKHLKHVTLYSVIFRSCFFLRVVAEFCKQFTSLTLVGVMPQFSCLYISDIIFVLKIAKNLSFIRINEDKFNPMFEGFWNAVGDAKNLEGICILTASNTHICTKTVLGGIRKLKHLHLFHFDARKASESLYKCVKQSMLLNGISNAKIPKRVSLPSSFRYQSIIHPYHIKSSLCCQESHLNDVNFF